MGEVVQRAWGTYEILAEGPRYKVKRLIMDPGKEFSLQRHHHRGECWVVVRGTACVIQEPIKGETREVIIAEGQAISHGVYAIHKLLNKGKIPVEIIETQYGSYLEEDDIERLDDVSATPAATES